MNKILLVGFVCVSLGALAQTSANQGQAPNAKTATSKTAAAPPDASSQTAGKRMHKPVEMQQEAGATAKTSGGKTANDDWTTSAAAKTNGSNNGQAGTHVVTGDVNRDGTPDLTATKSSGSATTKDSATGQTTGKRQHEPVTVKKEVDAASPKLK
jgi:hypothetical protein